MNEAKCELCWDIGKVRYPVTVNGRTVDFVKPCPRGCPDINDRKPKCE